MDHGSEYRQQVITEYRQTVVPLLKYLPWFEKNAGQTGSTYYRNPDGPENALRFLVFDSTLMSFIKEASKSSLMDRNYNYVYTRNHIKTHEDEKRLIIRAELKDWEILKGILSKYVLGGMTRGMLWSIAVQENIFCLTLKQMQKIIEYWDKPLDVR